jgi:phosphoribosylglycinamide formyltransferase-1
VLRIVVLISGRGSNMEALIRARDGGRLQVEIAAVISNHAAAGGLAVAAAHGIATTIVPHREFPDRASFDAALAGAIDAFEPGLVVLAGFMRILTPDFVDRYAGRLMNIHPSLLPAFPGLDTHERALAAGCKIHGATVHFVTPELDHGPIIAQAVVPILPNDDAEALARRVLALEHIIYPQAVGWFARGELSVESGVVRVTDPAARQLVMT